MVAVSNTSGLAGIAHWMNTYFRIPEEKKISKDAPLVQKVKEWVDREYEEGRVTSITDKELVEAVGRACDELGIQERPKR